MAALQNQLSTDEGRDGERIEAITREKSALEAKADQFRRALAESEEELAAMKANVNSEVALLRKTLEERAQETDALRVKVAEQQAEIERLNAELQARPANPPLEEDAQSPSDAVTDDEYADMARRLAYQEDAIRDLMAHLQQSDRETALLVEQTKRLAGRNRGGYFPEGGYMPSPEQMIEPTRLSVYDHPVASVPHVALDSNGDNGDKKKKKKGKKK